MNGAADTQNRLYEIVKDFNNAILVTQAADGRCHARPMAVAEIRPDGDVFFATGMQSPKAAEERPHRSAIRAYPVRRVRSGARP